MAEPLVATSVFDRLLKDRIIWLGSEVRDDNANEICAKILLLAAEDPAEGHLPLRQLARRLDHRRHGDLRHDAVRAERHRHRRHRHGGVDGPAAADQRHEGQALHHAERPRAAAPAARRLRRHRERHPDAGAADPRHEEAVSPRSPRRRPARPSSRSTPTATATAGSAPRRRSSTASSTTSASIGSRRHRRRRNRELSPKAKRENPK